MDKKLFMNIRGGKKFILTPKPVSEVEGIKTGFIEGPGSGTMTVPQQAIAPKITLMQRYVSAQGETFKQSDLRGVRLPAIQTEKLVAEQVEDIKLVNIKYPLVPINPAQGERVMAYAHIYFDKTISEIVYKVIEPPIGNNQKMLEQIKEYIQEKLDINFSQVRKNDAVGYLNAVFERALAYFRLHVDSETRETLKYYVLRDFIGLEKIEPLMADKNIEDISCDGLNIPIYVYHKFPQFGSIKTNIIFQTTDELDLFVSKLAERCGKSISVSKPMLDATLPDGSRLQATLGSDIAKNGSNFTIRMFSEKPITPVDLIKYGTCDLRMMAYFWFLVEHGSSVLISGATASGKTSLLNALSLFIKPQMKIVSIEDTAELRLPHAHWISEVARTPISEEGKVDMFELLRESLRQRPDYIIVGEVRGREAYVLFQQMAVGHPGISTVHAENFNKLYDRMVSPPISLPPNLLENLDLILFVKRVKQGRLYNRRIFSTMEVVGFDKESNLPVTNEIFTWDAKSDSFLSPSGESVLMKKISGSTGMTEKDLMTELEQRAKVLKWMVKRNINDYKQIAAVISMFYLSTDFLLRKIEGEL